MLGCCQSADIGRVGMLPLAGEAAAPGAPTEAPMSIVDKAIETQLKNIQAKTGKTLEQLGDILAEERAHQAR